MNATMKHLFFALALFCYTQVHAQTTDLIYHLGSGTSSSVIDITSTATDANGNIVVCGGFTGTGVDFDPLGAHTTKNAVGTGSGFIGLYNQNGTLKKIIVFGSNLNNKGIKVIVDPVSKNIYMLAKALGGSLNFAGTGFGSDQALAGSMVLLKYDSQLTLKSLKIFNDGAGNIGDVLRDITFYGPDLYVTGEIFSSNVEFNPDGVSTKRSSAGISDIIVAKYDTTTLSNIWVYTVGGAHADGGAAIDLDNTGNIYLTGYFTGQSIDIDPVGAKTVSEAGEGIASGDVFVAKYNPSMACQWAFNIGAVGEDKSTDLIVTNSSVYVSGYVKDDALNVYFDPNSITSSFFTGIGGYDLFVASYALDGNYQWHKATGSAGDDRATGLALDLGNNVVVSGYASGNVDFGNSKTITNLNTNQDAFFAVLSGSSGVATAAYNLGGASNEYATSVAVDPTGKIIVVGNYTDSGDYDIGNANTTPKSGTQDGFITRHVLCLPPSITTQPIDKAVCEGLNTSLSVSTTNATTYQWKKGGAVISGATNATYSISPAAISNGGSYTVVVGNACQSLTSNAVTLTVNPKPIINSNVVSTSCSSTSVGYSITSATASSYSWTRAVKGGITPATAGSGTTAGISEILTNTTNVPIDVIYSIIPTSTVGGCVGDAFSLTHTVNPKPSINSSSTGTICSGVAQSYTITSAVASSYKWSRALVAGVTNPAISNQTSNPISETLINNTINPVTVLYSITPTSTTGTCQGNAFTYSVTVNPTANGSVAIAANKTVVCAGDLITLTATPANGVVTPTYQWKKGGVAINEATNATFNTSTTANGETYTVEMYNNAACASASPIVSNPISITVNPVSNPTLTVTANNTTICPGTTVIFTATAVDAGTATYQWKKNDIDIASATNNTYNTNAATNGDYFSVVMTSPLACANPKTIQSDDITILFSAALSATINITATTATTICANELINFNSTSINGGTGATYQWKKGTTDIVGATNSSYSTTSAANGDSYSVVMTSTLACVSPKIVQSSPISITVTSSFVPSVSVSASDTTICANNAVTFTAIPVNGGTPTYKWKLGSNYISGATSSTYTTTGIANNASYSVEMTNPSACANPKTVLSAPVVITVNPILNPTAIISSVTPTICTSDLITFNVASTNQGASPSYVWYKNGSPIIPSATGSSYATTSAANGDKYKVALTSNAVCANSTPIFSNELVVNVNPLPIILGVNEVCEGSTISLSGSGTANSTSPWVSSNSANASVTNLGIVTGVLVGTSTITYTNNNGCKATTSITVNEKPKITGTLTLCVGTTTQLIGTSTPATTTAWTSASTPVATISNTGLVTGVSAGVSIITYKTISGCTNTVTVTVTNLPTITGTSIVCIGSTTQLLGSGTSASSNPWVSATPSVATVSSTGVITGLTAGTSIITFTNSNGCKTSQLVTVNPILVPSVSITANNATICAGTNVVLKANPENGGSAPIYKWKLNNVVIGGATNDTYSTMSATNGQSYTVEMISNQLCASTSAVISNPIVITVTTSVTPKVTVIASPSNNVCAATLTTFTATPDNGGIAPTFQWKKGGVAIASATNATYVSSSFVTGDIITVDMVSNSSCASTPNATSEPITITVTPKVNASVVITASSTAICENTNVIFTAVATKPGVGPTYEWFVNNISQGILSASNTFTVSSLLDNDQVKVSLTSNETCVNVPTVISNSIVMDVTTKLVPIVSVVADKTTSCAAEAIKFTATATNGGSSAQYQWKINNVNSGSPTGSNIFTTTSLLNGNTVSVDLTSSISCVTENTVSSAGIEITVAPVTQIVTQPTNQSVCLLGDNITFTVGAVGANLNYQWKVGGTNLANNSTYTGVKTKDLTISNVAVSDLVGYQVVVSGTCGNSTSTVANLTQSTSSISILTQPAAQSKYEGETIQLSIAATGPTLSYQWKKNGVNLVDDSRISGSNTASLQLSNAVLADASTNYTCLITSPCATQLTSNVVVVTVTSIPSSTQDALAKGFKIAPNPSNGRFNISNEFTPFIVNQIEIVSMQGVVVASKTVNASTYLNEDMYAQDLPKGMYMVLIKGDDEQALLKVVIDK